MSLKNFSIVLLIYATVRGDFQVNLFNEMGCTGDANRIQIPPENWTNNPFKCTELKGDRAKFKTRSVSVAGSDGGNSCQGKVSISSKRYCDTTGTTFNISCSTVCTDVELSVISILTPTSNTKSNSDLNSNLNSNSNRSRASSGTPSSTPAQRGSTPREWALETSVSTSSIQRVTNVKLVVGVGSPSLLEVSLFSASNCGGSVNRVLIRTNWENPNSLQCTVLGGQSENFYTRSVQTGNCDGFWISFHPTKLCTITSNSTNFQLACGTCANVELNVKSVLVVGGRNVGSGSSRSEETTPRPRQRPSPQQLPVPLIGNVDLHTSDIPPGENGNSGSAGILQHRFHISYNSLAPDGVTVGHVLTINNRFPGPILYVTEGDTMVVEVTNGIQDGQNMTLHWHGIHQKGTPFQDGPSFVTQCPIRAGGTQTYRFHLRQTGTYWYHSHVGSQYTEGLWGALVVQGGRKIYNYDAEFTITLNDWYHTSAKENEQWFLTSRSGGFPPYPYSVLMNGLGQYGCEFTSKPCSAEKQQRPVFKLNPGRIYRLRLINTSAWTSFNFAIDGPKLLPIEVDGVDVMVSQQFYGSDDPDSVFIGPGQRYSFLLKKVGGVSFNKHVIRAILREDLIGSPPHNINENAAALNPLVTGLIVYTNDERYREITIVPMDVEPFDYTSYIVRSLIRNYIQVNDSHLVPHDRKLAPQRTDREYVVTVVRTTDSNNVHHVAFNNSAFSLPHDRPLLISMMRNDPLPASSFPLYIEHNEVVQLVVNNPSFGLHPMHLHGHTFWVMGAGEPGEGDYSPERHKLNRNGIRRDTVMVQEFSWLVIKFIADNPGVWAFHCHIDWHNLAGMALTFVEAPDVARAKLKVPAETKRVCRQHGIII